MALNAFWGNKKVIIVNESACKLGKEIVKELEANNFNNVRERGNLNFCSIADAEPAYVLVVEESAKNRCVPFRTEGHVGDRVGHYVTCVLDRADAREYYENHIEGIKTIGRESFDFEKVKKNNWFYNDKVMTPFLKLEVPYSDDNVKGVAESIKDFFKGRAF